MTTASRDIEQSGFAESSLQGKRATEGGSNSALCSPHSALKWALAALPLAWLWFQLISSLWPEWNTNPQYGYGLVVPILVLALLLFRWSAARDHGTAGPPTTDLRPLASALRPPPSDLCPPSPVVRSPWSVVLFIVCAFLFLPTRLVEAATPEWRPLQWMLGLETVGLTLITVYWSLGRRRMLYFAFPICFFLVAIPWPTPLEQPLIQGLTQANSSIVIEVLGIMGIPAVQHGNLIEVGTGTVGLEEACSGIRSFQSSLMISLFLGEFYRLGLWRRLLLVPVGFTVAFGFNVCRTTLLTKVAAKQGIGAIADYHDQAGLTILLACTATLWLLAWLLARKQSKHHGATGPLTTGPLTSDLRPLSSAPSVRGPQSPLRAPGSMLPAPCSRPFSFQLSAFSACVPRFALALLVWLILVESSVHLWYLVRERQIKPGPSWTVKLPETNPTFKQLPMPETTRKLLRFDESAQGGWLEEDESRWRGFYFNWLPGRVAGYLAKRHTPEICLSAAGCQLTSGPELTVLSVHGIALPVRAYLFSTPDGSLHVFHCRWEVGAGNRSFVERESSRLNLVRGIWAGRGRHGQKVFEFMVTGYDSPVQAKAALVKQLEKLIRVEGRTTDY